MTDSLDIEIDAGDALTSLAGGAGALVALAATPPAIPEDDLRPVARRLRRMGMESVEITSMTSGLPLVEFRIPGRTPPEEMGGVAGMRQFRSTLKFGDSPAEVTDARLRYPTILYDEPQKDAARKEVQAVIDAASPPRDERVSMKGGGGIGQTGYTPHLFFIDTEGIDTDRLLRFIDASAEAYTDRFFSRLQ